MNALTANDSPPRAARRREGASLTPRAGVLGLLSLSHRLRRVLRPEDADRPVKQNRRTPGGRHLARAAALALVMAWAGFAALLTPAPAQAAEIELWSSTLTVGKRSDRNDYGYNLQYTYGSLSPTHFRHGGKRYTRAISDHGESKGIPKGLNL